MDLQFLFDTTVKEVTELSPGYDGHASDVWLVKTEDREVVVRTSTFNEEPESEFWYGCNKLFGIDPRNVHQLHVVNNILSEAGSLPVPKVIVKGEQSRQFVVVEKLEGTTVQSFIGQPASVIQNLGEGLARIHQLQRNYAGHPVKEQFALSLSDFHRHLADVMGDLVHRYYHDQKDIKDMLPEMKRLVQELPAPRCATFVMADMDPTQFLSDGQCITGLVDTEAYAVAPRELEFMILEYVLDRDTALEFKKGYEKVMPLPDMKRCRKPYRFLGRLLRVQGRVEIEKWMSHEKLF